MQSALDYLPDIADLPLILAGAILRRTEPDRVTVWLALKEARSLCLEIYATKDRGATIDTVLLEGHSDTIRLGKHLHVVAITAKPKDDVLLQPGEIYAYNVYCTDDRYSLIDDTRIHQYNLSYFSHQLPTFCLPPNNLNDLKIVHGSCRKPHGGGRDTLSCLDNLINDSPADVNNRPHQLFLTGDQIYGDDVADVILWLAQGVNRLVFGWSEELPLLAGTISADELPPGKRTDIARIEGGLTAMLENSPEKAKSHLFSFGEYAAVYLLSLSPVFMPSRFPAGKSLFKDKKQSRHWEEEIDETKSFIRDLSSVRRALANIPTYTICDDHDISDDWYLNRTWCDRVLGKPLGKRVVQNGVLAYALFQAWGNTPEEFAPGTGGEKLLQLASRWSASEGKDTRAKMECDRYLGIPILDKTSQLPRLEEDEDVLILQRDDRAIPWYYTVRGSKHEVVVVDTRTWRGYPRGKDKGLLTPMLLSPQAFKQQLQIPLSQSPPEIEATFVVIPTNLVTLGLIDRVQEFELSRKRVFNSDVGDSWNFHTSAFAKLLLSLCQRNTPRNNSIRDNSVIILSGDIHYSSAVRLTHWFHDTLETNVLVQLTSSAIKNSETATRIAHTKLKSLFREKTQFWLGWEQPFELKKVNKSFRWRKKTYLNSNRSLPDWQYRIEWCQRQPVQSLSWQQSSFALENEQNNLWQKTIEKLIDWLWRNRWLQEGPEIIGRNNLSLVKFEFSTTKTVIQETYWHPPWNSSGTVKSRYEISLESEALPPLKKTDAV